MYNENHSLGEWFSKRLLSIMRTKRTPFAIIKMRSANCTKVAKGGHSKMNGVKSLSHTSWNCKYHIVFAPKYRRKVFYGEKRKEIGANLKKAV